MLLFPSQIRWFYKREVEKDWTPFMGYDSLRIELRYRHIWQTKWSDADRNADVYQQFCILIYSVTHQVVLKVLLASKQKFRFSIKSLYQNPTLILMSTKPREQPDV